MLQVIIEIIGVTLAPDDEELLQSALCSLLTLTLQLIVVVLQEAEMEEEYHYILRNCRDNV